MESEIYNQELKETQNQEIKAVINAIKVEEVKAEVVNVSPLYNAMGEAMSQSLDSEQQISDHQSLEIEKAQDKLSQEKLSDRSSIHDEQFYDCDEIDHINEKLRIQQGQKLHDLVDHDENEIPLQMEPQSQSDQEWVEKKIAQMETQSYLSLPSMIVHSTECQPLNLNERKYQKELEGGNFLYRQDWIRDEKYGAQNKLPEDRGQILIEKNRYFYKKIDVLGSSLLTGKSLTSISMPVDIFEPRSNTERVSNAMGYAPIFLEEAAAFQDKIQRVKNTLAFAFGFLYNYLSIEKVYYRGNQNNLNQPFNPILGETYQGWLDKCPVYCEQVSHHPPIAVVQVYGRGYEVDARLEMVANIHSNSVTGKNIGYIKVIYENPRQEVYVILAPGLISGTTFGDRIFNFNQKQHCIDLENKVNKFNNNLNFIIKIVAECIFNPDKRQCQFLNLKHINASDYVVGGIYEVNEAAIQRFRKESYKKYTGLDLKNDIQQIHHLISGYWTTEMSIDNTRLISPRTDFPIMLNHALYPLASDATYRMDALWWKLRNFDKAQSWKEKMELEQRQDRKLREATQTKKK